MDFLRVVIKILVILAMILLMAIPFIMEYLVFRRDKERKISYKRLRIVLYTAVYIVAVTVALYFLKELVLWLESLPVIQWIATKISLSARVVYCGRVLAVIALNFAIGFLFWFLSKFVRIGLKKKNLLVPKKKDGEFNLRQKLERRIVKFFHTETWFFVGRLLKILAPVLSAIYALIFALYLMPALFGASWIPYDFISTLFVSGYLYPTITLLGLWEAYYFLAGIKRIEEECPELLKEEKKEETAEVDLAAIDKEIRKQFSDYYACTLDLSGTAREELTSAEHSPITEYIAQAVESDKRNPQAHKEAYLNCVDKLVEDEKGLLINGNFFSEFSMYFLRYLSAVVARGDNVIFVCNTDAQIDSVYEYLVQGLSEISSLFCKGFRTDAVDFDDPIWRVIKVSGERSAIEDAAVDENNILVTSLGYLCSSRFENEHSKFASLIDTVVFVDVLVTVNTFHRQLSILNTRLKHIAKKNSLAVKNGNVSDMFRMRYMSRQVRYICFDDTRTPGLDKILKNMLSVDFDSADAMNHNAKAMVRCYNFEGKVGDNGRRKSPQFINSEEEVGSVMNMALLCLAKGAPTVSVFTDDVIPYRNIAETISANMGKISVKADADRIRLNKPFYNPDSYSVMIAVDSSDNLPAAIRRYTSMLSDKPALVIIFSRPYMLRDYYVGNIDDLWVNSQTERVPVEEGKKRDIAQRILVKASAGGISRAETLYLASSVPQFSEYVGREDVEAILRGVLEEYGETLKSRMDLFKYFEYVSSQDFDETGNFGSDVKIMLRRQGKLFDSINGRDMAVMVTGDTEIALPVPRSRLKQNFIAGQNLIHNGNIYHIQKLDAATGRIYTRLAVGGKNDEAYRYVQARNYRLNLDPAQTEPLFSEKHVTLHRFEENIGVDDVYLSVFRAPMEVLTDGYFAMDPHSLSVDVKSEYHKINDPGNDGLARQTYRCYGAVTDPAFPSEGSAASEQGAIVMTLRICGKFGSDVDKVTALAAVMLNQTLQDMFPSVADSLAVCPVLHRGFSDEESEAIFCIQPKLTLVGESGKPLQEDFELVIIEDCTTDLGVASVLMSAGDDVLDTLFTPVFRYLEWYAEEKEKSSYLWFGLEREPACFDFPTLHKLSKLLGDDKHDLNFVNIESLIEYDVCDFCGKRYAKNGDVIALDDGRKMCKACAENLVGSKKKVLKSYLDHAKLFLESTYGISLEDDYEFCFESTVKIAGALKQNRNLIRRGTDVPLRSYIDGKKKVHMETSVPAVSLSELLVRELTHVWQLKHLPELEESLAEGHIALVAIQYLAFLNQSKLAAVRTAYYESTNNPSGEGYRKLVRELIAEPQFRNNPFLYLLEVSGLVSKEVIEIPTPRIAESGDYGLPYTPEVPDRVLDGDLPYFYRSRLTATCQKAYDTVLEAIRNHDGKVTVDGCTVDDMRKVSFSILYDHPELFWYNTFGMVGSEVTLFYGASSEEAAVLQKRIDEAVPKYLEGIDDTMSAYDVAIRIHAKLVDAVDYDSIALEKQEQEGGPAMDKIDYLRTICGVFLDGKAVCAGYARATQYLLQKCGVECAEAVGDIWKENGEKGGSHAWNILKVDGDYYYMDTTWDDRSNTVQTVKNMDLGYDYFCITTEEISRTRDTVRCPTAMPDCYATKANYYFHNHLVIEGYDLGKIKAMAQAAAKSGKKEVTFKCKSKEVFDKAFNQLIAVGQDGYEVVRAAAKANRKILGNSYSRRYDKNLWTLTLTFKYK